jgi:hypothetical protein
MIIYNVTVNIDQEVHKDWLDWMRASHIPKVMDTGCFTDHRICRVLSDEDTGFTYSIQYSCKDMETMDRYKRDHAPQMQKEVGERYKDKFIAFRTLLEVIK